MAFYDPEGERHGLPTYPWKAAPEGLATRGQLAKQGLRPDGAAPVAQVMWRSSLANGGRGKTRTACLYPVDLAVPKRVPTAGNLRAVAAMNLARRVCGECDTEQPYTIPRRYGMCLDCADAGGWL
jgi:hypothetical protein